MLVLLLRVLVAVFLVGLNTSADTAFKPIRSVKEPYILDVHMVQQGERNTRGTIVTFSVSDAVTGKLLYTCPEMWRMWDLFSIGWARDGYTIIVDSSDVGTSSYSLAEGGWRKDMEGVPFHTEVRDGYTLEVWKRDYLEEQDSVYFRVTKEGRIAFRSELRIYVTDADQAAVHFAETGLDIAVADGDGGQEVFKFEGDHWIEPPMP